MKKIIFLVALMGTSVFAAPLRQSLRKQVLRSFPAGTRVQIESVHLEGGLPEAYSLLLLSPQPPAGLVNFEVVSHSEKYKRSFGTAVVRVFSKVAVSRTSLSNRENFGPHNITFEMREIGALAGVGFFSDPSKLFSLTVRGYVQPGRIIRLSDTQAPLLVQPGQNLSLSLEKKGMVISAKVRALEGGEMSRMIRVENPSSKKILTARVVGPGEVMLP